jgi:hypothetical protein
VTDLDLLHVKVISLSLKRKFQLFGEPYWRWLEYCSPSRALWMEFSGWPLAEDNRAISVLIFMGCGGKIFKVSHDCTLISNGHRQILCKMDKIKNSCIRNFTAS